MEDHTDQASTAVTSLVTTEDMRAVLTERNLVMIWVMGDMIVDMERV